MKNPEKQAAINCMVRGHKRTIRTKFKNYRKAVLNYCDSGKESDKRQIARALLDLVAEAYQAYGQLYKGKDADIIFNDFMKGRKKNVTKQHKILS